MAKLKKDPDMIACIYEHRVAAAWLITAGEHAPAWKTYHNKCITAIREYAQLIH